MIEYIVIFTLNVLPFGNLVVFLSSFVEIRLVDLYIEMAAILNA